MVPALTATFLLPGASRGSRLWLTLFVHFLILIGLRNLLVLSRVCEWYPDTDLICPSEAYIILQPTQIQPPPYTGWFLKSYGQFTFTNWGACLAPLVPPH